MLTAVLLALAGAGQRRAVPETPPSVIVFDLDDVAAVDVSTYGGHAPTPNLDALAARGVRFDDFQAAPTCSPSRRCLQTGRWWLRESGHACSPADATTPPLSTVFLPEALPGYSSALFGKWHLGGDPAGGPWQMAPISQGWEHWIAGQDQNVGDCGGSDFMDWDRVDADALGYVEGISHAYEPAAVAYQFALAWPLAPKPGIAMVCTNLAHVPFHIPPPYALPPGYSIGALSNRSKYEADIAAYDYLIGRMLSLVDLDHTVVIVLGDNGTPLNAAGADRDKAKGTTFWRGLETPLVISGPGFVQGVVAPDLCHLVDVYATIVDIAGGPPVPGCDGVSLLPTLNGAPHAPYHDVVLCGDLWNDPAGGDRAAISLGWKLRQLDPDGDGVPDSEELYDEIGDPHENVNRIGDTSLASIAASLRAFIAAESP